MIYYIHTHINNKFAFQSFSRKIVMSRKAKRVFAYFLSSIAFLRIAQIVENISDFYASLNLKKIFTLALSTVKERLLFINLGTDVFFNPSYQN